MTCLKYQERALLMLRQGVSWAAGECHSMIAEPQAVAGAFSQHALAAIIIRSKRRHSILWGCLRRGCGPTAAANHRQLICGVLSCASWVPGWHWVQQLLPAGRLSFNQQPVVFTRRQSACQCIGGPTSDSSLPACPCSACCLGGSLT